MAKPKKPLTDRSISAAKPADPGKRKLLWDAQVPGLAIRVTDQGAKSFVLVTRYPGSKNPAPRSLGTYGAITLADARTKAQAWYKQIAAGIDPTTAETERLAQTFRAISDDYFARKAKDHRSKDWAQSALARLVYPSLGSKPIDAITRSDIVRVFDAIADGPGPVMANRTLSLITRILNWHSSRSEFRSPIVRGMARATEAARARILSDDEIRALWSATGLIGSFVRFLLLTATRRNETAHARWTEFDGADWIIPAERYKTRIDHLIPLSKMALAQLSPRQGDYVFSLTGKAAFCRFDPYKQKIDEETGVKDWVFHDCRRTARSLMSRAGVNADHAERCLGHRIGGVRGIYDRYEFRREKALAFEALAAQIDRIVSPRANVVGMRG
jgi:integrase